MATYVRLVGDKAMNNIAKDLEPVAAAVHLHARLIAAKAEGRLVPHTKTGEHHIEIEYGRVDAYVWLVGPAALSVEFGHDVYNDNEQVAPLGYAHGLYIITGAAGLI
jgi:hypothetical protein